MCDVALAPAHLDVFVLPDAGQVIVAGRRYSNGMDFGRTGTGIFKPGFVTQDVTTFSVVSAEVTPFPCWQITGYNLSRLCRRDFIRIE